MPSSTLRRQPKSTLFPYTPLFRSEREIAGVLVIAPRARPQRGGRLGEARRKRFLPDRAPSRRGASRHRLAVPGFDPKPGTARRCREDRKSTRLNSSHRTTSYAVFYFTQTTEIYTLSLHAALPI